MKRQDTIAKIILEEFKSGKHNNRLVINDIISYGIYDECIAIYKGLGGISNQFPVNFGKWDIDCSDFIIEFDEEQHFNRYRAFTLTSIIYNKHNRTFANEYLNYCIDYEVNCLRKSSFGNYWTNDSTEKQFGESDPPGQLGTSGSSRWKQRAYYDFLRDVYGIIYDIPVIRISIYDIVRENNNQYSLNQILKNKNVNISDTIINLLYSKVP
ncbi:hypothetical protein ACFLR8_01480 [Bacteroidota bacterium]